MHMVINPGTMNNLVDLPLEATLIACLIDCPSEIPETRRLVSPEMMMTTDHKRLIKAIYDLDEQGIKLDWIQVYSQLRKDGVKGDLDTCLDTSEYSFLAIGENVHECAVRLKDLARRRKLVIAATVFIQGCSELSKDIDFCFYELEEQARDGHSKVSMSSSEVMSKLLEDLESQRVSGVSPIKKTGCELFDKLIDLTPGEYGVIGGVSGSGKSTLMRWIALGLAKGQENQPPMDVLYMTTEMRPIPVGHCFISQLSEMPVRVIRDSRSQLEWQRKKIEQTCQEFAQLTIEVNATPAIALDEMVNEIRRFHHAHRDGNGIAILFDHLHELTGLRNRESEHEFFNRATSQFLTLAQQLNCIFLCNSQLSYQGNFRESSTIEQRAAWAMKIVQSQVKVPRMTNGDTLLEFQVKKGRFVSRSSVPVLFHGAMLKFEALDDEQMMVYAQQVD